jgi:hypothetical protein
MAHAPYQGYFAWHVCHIHLRGCNVAGLRNSACLVAYHYCQQHNRLPGRRCIVDETEFRLTDSIPPQLNWQIVNAIIATGIIPNLNMYQKLLKAIQTLFGTDHLSGAKISCYHCGEKSTPSRTVYVQFEGDNRAVCCNGCAAILKTVEELGMNEEYHAHKIQCPIENE